MTPPCGVPRSVGKSRPFAVAPGSQHRANQTQDAAVRDLLGCEREQLVVVHHSEEVPQISVHSPLAPELQLFPDFAQGIMLGSPSSVSEAGVIEHRLEDRIQPAPLPQSLRIAEGFRRSAQPGGSRPTTGACYTAHRHAYRDGTSTRKPGTASQDAP